jgi:hypothetical protein
MSPLTISPTALARSPKDQSMHLTTPAAATTAGSAGGSRRRPLATRVATVLAAVVASVAGLGLASTPAIADDCPNAALRAQNNSTQLPDCRAYELVSPVFKEGFSPITHGFTDDGRLAYASNGNYANNGNGGSHLAGGNQYMAIRSASGWSTKALAPSGPDYFTANPPRASRLSSDLRSSLWLMRRSDQTDAVSDLYVRRPDDVFARVGSAGDPLAPLTTSLGARYFTASNDLSHVVFSVGGEGADGIYEYDGTGADQPRAVSVDNAGQRVAPGCGTQVGGPDSDYHAVSADGRVIFWTAKCAAQVVYTRVGGATTIEASASQCTRVSSDPGGACDADSAAVFRGANADGTRVFFTTGQQLVNADTDATTDLYECDIPSGTPAPVGSVNPCPDLRKVSGAATGAEVQGLTRISDDGSRAYFVAKGVLAANLGAGGAAAVAGDPNLYVWQRDAAHPAGETRFVAKLDPADGGLWDTESSFGRMAQATDDGRYLVFATYAALIDHGPGADSDAARDVYRYDAGTGALIRLSADTEGGGGNEPGHDALFNPIAYAPTIPSTRGPRTAMSDDGQSVVFTSADALVPSDTNGTTDSHLWHDGRVSLISSGKPSEDSTLLAGDSLANSIGGGIQVFITPSGGDVYFTTTAQLTPNDVDTLLDIYDARVEGGFDLSTPPTCSGVACQGPPSAPPPATKPGSTLLTGQDGSPQTTPAFSVTALTATQRKRIASTGKVTLSVTTSAPGTLLAKATATIAKRPSTVGSAKRTVAKAGTVSLSLTLSKKARAELKRKRKLTVKVLVGQDNVAIARTVSLRLTQPKAAKKAKGKSSRGTSRPAVFKGGRS